MRNIFDYVSYLICAGGGPRKVPKYSETIIMALSIMGRSAEGLENIVDSDATITPMTQESATQPDAVDLFLPVTNLQDIIEEKNTSADTNISMQEDENWTSWNPNLLRRPVSSPLKERITDVFREQTGIEQQITSTEIGATRSKPTSGSEGITCPIIQYSSVGMTRGTSRRRPTLNNHNNHDELHRSKVEYFKVSTEHLKQEIEIRQQLAQEWLKQEELKTKILETQYKKLQEN